MQFNVLQQMYGLIGHEKKAETDEPGRDTMMTEAPIHALMSHQKKIMMSKKTSTIFLAFDMAWSIINSQPAHRLIALSWRLRGS